MYIRQREPAKIVSKEWKLTIVFLRGLNVVSPDGNGRMSRLLTLLLFYKAGYIVGKYVSMEMLIEKTKETYYEALPVSYTHLMCIRDRIYSIQLQQLIRIHVICVPEYC